MIRIFWLVVYYCLFLSASLLVVGTEDNPKPVGEVVVMDYVLADVNGHAITLSMLENELAIRQIENPSETIKKQILDSLIEQEIMFQAADRSGILLVRWDRKVAAEVEQMQAKYDSEAHFLRDLAESGLTLVDLQAWFRRRLILENFVARRFANRIDREEIGQAALIYYEKNRAQFRIPAEIRFQYVLISIPSESPPQTASAARLLAKQVYQQLVEGGTFRQIAALYTETAQTKEEATIPKSEGQPVVYVAYTPQISAANTKLGIDIAQLETGRLNQPKLTPNGYLIAKLLGKTAPQDQPYEAVRELIQNQLLQERIESDLQTWLDTERKNSSIQDLSDFAPFGEPLD